MFTQVVTPAPALIPRFNTGCQLDIVTGDPVTGMKGETIINGGIHHLEGQAGEANSAKTGLELYRLLVATDHYEGSSTTAYDVEGTLNRERITKQAQFIAPNLLKQVQSADGSMYTMVDRFEVTTTVEYLGDEFYKAFKEYGENRPKLKADHVDTPFKDPKSGKPIRILPPQFAFIDSLSKFGTKATADIEDKADIGHKDRNMFFMKDGMVKTQMLNELPTLSVRDGLYFVMTAQLGENKNLDPYAAPRQTLSFLKTNMKLKRVPDEYRYNVHNLWFNFTMKALLNSTTKAPEYPRDASENEAKGDTDLQYLLVMNLRGKSGSSGKPITIVYSQSEGVKASLSEFHAIRDEKFGMSESKGKFVLDLYPEANLGRTTIRGILEEDEKVKTAVKLTSDLLQITHEWRHLPKGLVCDPKTLYDDIKALGYDWDTLLQSRSYWTFDQYTNEVPFLSIMDLLYMREGSYHPYWLEKK